ncbi:hypothetical protein MWU59_10705 [Flavobacteriaceae bacterium F08102]|nr:hypothetical protein [Flavobacteriaceae bacterium F08102]
MQKPVYSNVYTSPSTQVSKIQAQDQLTNPLFYESQGHEISFTLDNFDASALAKFLPFATLTSKKEYHAQIAKTNFIISNQHALKTRTVDLLYPSHFFW